MIDISHIKRNYRIEMVKFRIKKSICALLRVRSKSVKAPFRIGTCACTFERRELESAMHNLGFVIYI